MVVEKEALARDVDHDTAGGAVLVLLRLGRVAVLGDRRRVLEGEPHDVHVTSAGAFRCEGHGCVGLRGGGDLGGEALQCLHDAAEVGAGGGRFGLVDPDIEDEAASFGAVGHRADLASGRRGRCGERGRCGRCGSGCRCGGKAASGGESGVDGCERHGMGPFAMMR